MESLNLLDLTKLAEAAGYNSVQFDSIKGEFKVYKQLKVVRVYHRLGWLLNFLRKEVKK